MKTPAAALKRIDLIILSIIFILGLVLRLYKIDTPLADLHSWRQVDTAAVSRNFARDGINLLYPHYDDLSSIQSGIENPEGLRMVEFPLYNAIMAISHSVAPSFPIEVHGRFISALFSLFIVITLYILAYKELGRVAAVVSAGVFAVFPAFFFFSRMVLPDMIATSFAMLAILFLYLWQKNTTPNKNIALYGLSSLSFAIALLVKPTVIFYLIPIILIFYREYGLRGLKHILLYAYFLITFVPFILWRVHISRFPEAIPASSWLITSVNTFEGQKTIFFRPAFFRWIFFERINNIILGGFLAPLFVLGLIGKVKYYLLHSIIAAGFVYIFVFQGGNVQHEYYQIVLLPAIALAIGMGAQFILEHRKSFLNPVITVSVLIFFTALSMYFSFYRVRDFYNTPNDLSQIANIIQTLTGKNDKIVTDRLGDTTLLYLSDRKGSPAVLKSPAEYAQEGYKFLVTADPQRREEMKTNFTVVFDNDQFTLFRL